MILYNICYKGMLKDCEAVHLAGATLAASGGLPANSNHGMGFYICVPVTAFLLRSGQQFVSIGLEWIYVNLGLGWLDQLSNCVRT